MYVYVMFIIATTHTVSYSPLHYQFLVVSLLPTVIPLITKHPENVHVIHNTDVTLQCKAVGGSNITYRWTKDDAIIQTPDNGGSLIIVSVQQSDEGAYQCMAINNRGETATSNSARVVVYGKYHYYNYV